MNALHVLVAIAVLLTVAGGADPARAGGMSGPVCPFLAAEQTAARETAKEAGATAGKVTKKGRVEVGGTATKQATKESNEKRADSVTAKTAGKASGKASGKTTGRGSEKSTGKSPRKTTGTSMEKATPQHAPRRSTAPAARPHKGLTAMQGDMQAWAGAHAMAGMKTI